MSWIHRLSSNLKRLTGRSRFEKDMDEEMQVHFEMEKEANLRRGLSPQDALEVTRRDFGSVERYKEECRDTLGVRVYHDFTDDVRYGLRQLMKFPLLTSILLATVAFCIGANVAVFSLVHSIWLEPYSYPDLDRVVHLGMLWPKVGLGDKVQEISTRGYLDIKEASTSFEALGFHSGGRVDLHLGERVMRIDYAKVTPEIWDVARIQPLMGRVFNENDLDAGNDKVAVLTYGLWTQLFGDSEDILDREIRVDSDSYQVIGVMPQSFSLVQGTSRMWIPKVFSELERSEESRGMHGFQAVGRLKQGVAIASARQELDAIYQRYLEESPERRKFAEDTGESLGIALVGDWVSDRSSGSMVLSVQAAGVLILLIGCLNVAGIILVRGQRRIRELTMRHALGASRLRIARQLMTETVLLFAIGGGMGLVIARWAMTLLPSQIGFQDAFKLGGLPEINGTVFLLTLGLILLCGLVAGSIPAYVAMRGTLGNTLQTLNMGKASGGHRHALQNAFVIAQVALAFVLLVGAGALIRNVEGLLTEGFGCEPVDRIAVEVALPKYRFGSSRNETRERVNPFKDEALKQIRALPGVKNATFANRVPLSKNNPNKSEFEPGNYEPGPGEMVFAIWYQVDSAYFQTMGIPLLAGRSIAPSDTWDSPPVVVVSETIAARYYQGRDPIQETLRFWGVDCTIVGVVGDTLDVPMHYGDAPTLYFPYTQWPVTRQVEDTTLVVQTELSLENMREPIGNILHSIDPMLTFDFSSMEQIRDKAMISRSAPMEIAGVFAVAAILLAAMGIYGVLAASVSGRTKEIGIRLSLGARKSSIFGGVLARGARLTLVGLLLGSMLSIFPLRWLNTLLTEVNATSLDIPFFVALLVVAVALLASYLPARRAIKTDPAFTLRYE